MDELDDDCLHFKTPLLTPHNSNRNRTEQYPDGQLSILQIQNEHMTALQRTFEHDRNLSFSSHHNQEYDSEYESDLQEKRATEANDDSNDPQLKEEPVQEVIGDSLHFQTSQEHYLDLYSPTQESKSLEENFSDIISDLDCNYETKLFDSSADVCSESLCEPYTVKQDEENVEKFLQTKFTTLTIENSEPKKEEKYVKHIMISYNHSTRPLCTRIANKLKNLNYLVWIDQDNISGDILTSMASAIENAYVVLMAINEQYHKSRYCRLEAEYAVERNKISIPMLMQPDYKPTGWLGIINGSKLYIDFVQLPFDEAFSLLLREIDTIRTSLGIGDGDLSSNSSSIYHNYEVTTINNTWNHYQNVHEWNNQDLIEWLNREKLEIFENALTYFNGATLWEFYKIKFDSPTDYYRYVDSLLPSTTPHRLFYNLTFNGAIEALFASSTSKLQRY